MNESFLKDIVYDLIESKLKIKELEDKLTILTKSNDSNGSTISIEVYLFKLNN